MRAVAMLDKYFLSRRPSHNRQLDSLDGIRGLAVLWVLLGHMGNRDLLPLVEMKHCAVYGVDLFFVLSGFLLTLPFLERRDNEVMAVDTWKRYFLRRILRIYPAYVVVLLFYLILSEGLGFIPPSSEVFYDAWGVFRHLALLDGQSVHWTIPVELRFYMILPVVLILTATLSRNLRAKAGLVFLFVTAFLLVQHSMSFITDRSTMLFHLPVFLLGFLTCAAYLGIEGAGDRFGRTLYDLGGWLSFALIVATIPSIWRSLGFPEVDFQKFPIIHGILWSCMLLCTLKGNGVLSRVFSLRVLRTIGIISFSIYLWHMPVIYLVKKSAMVKWGTFSQFVFILAAALLLSSMSYMWVESPFLYGRLSRVILSKRRELSRAAKTGESGGGSANAALGYSVPVRTRENR